MVHEYAYKTYEYISKLANYVAQWVQEFCTYVIFTINYCCHAVARYEIETGTELFC